MGLRKEKQEHIMSHHVIAQGEGGRDRIEQRQRDQRERDLVRRARSGWRKRPIAARHAQLLVSALR